MPSPEKMPRQLHTPKTFSKIKGSWGVLGYMLLVPSLAVVAAVLIGSSLFDDVKFSSLLDEPLEKILGGVAAIFFTGAAIAALMDKGARTFGDEE